MIAQHVIDGHSLPHRNTSTTRVVIRRRDAAALLEVIAHVDRRRVVERGLNAIAAIALGA